MRTWLGQTDEPSSHQSHCPFLRESRKQFSGAHSRPKRFGMSEYRVINAREENLTMPTTLQKHIPTTPVSTIERLLVLIGTANIWYRCYARMTD